ncbi:hypothetical protein QEZ54_10505 [Catellatospora sp. KI3]|uniref:hypothetical protein n=1 Tax=Catellatospora sp. KI3 TaxID=3041620 RepID=UPI0024827173|nr:hypothetical protein [Catellatospora sp. KI3]MDI1461400.1 hypothetical protein [Catellatospora sp. KI3]
MTDPMLRDLKEVSDETLYVRLIRIRQRFPTDYSAEDYEFRRDTWERANRAVREEITRRDAKPPPWLPLPAPTSTDQLREHVRGDGRGWFVVGVLAGVVLLVLAIGRAFAALTVS